jgi:hypothetical protein
MSKVHIIMFTIMLLILFVTLLIFFIVVFQRMKNIMRDCNTMLKVMPFEFLDKETQDQIKHFIIN